MDRLVRLLPLLMVAVLTADVWSQQATPKYNVLFIMSDDLRAECTTYGGKALTPNIDALAKAGVRFDKAYCQFAICNPSRASMLTGRHPATTGVLDNRQGWREAHPDWISLPQLFRENGYVSLRTGKVFHGYQGLDDPKAWTEIASGSRTPAGQRAGQRVMEIPPQAVPPQPPDILPPSMTGQSAANSDRILVMERNGEGNGDYNTADHAIEFLRKYKDQPFFIACGFVKPRSPLAAPQRFFDLYDLSKIQLPPDFAAWPTVPAGFPKAAIRMRNSDLFIGRGASELEAREMTRAYYASTSWVDWNLGRVMEELDKLGLREKTIVVFWGDHGYHLGDKGKWSKAGSLFEAGTRVPLIIVHPGAAGNGKPSPRTVQSIDIYPTLAELCGLKIQDGIEGKSLVPLLSDPQAVWDRPAYSVWSIDGQKLDGVAVRTEKWRYAEYGPDGADGAMLLDPAADPFELKNLADDPKLAAVRAELSALVRKYAANPGKPQL